DILLGAQSLFIFLFAGYEYITLMHFPSLPNQKAAEPGRPFVSIILPVRNQARTVEDCVASLTHLDYAEKEIIIVDGGSTDGTLDKISKYSDMVRIVHEDPLPAGWVGKNWACNQGYRESRGELLLFTDGDSIHGIDSLARSVGYLQAEKADMVSLAPGTILRSFWERVLQPPIFLLIMILVGGKLVNNDKRLNAIGNGQYMLFTRQAYEKLGGHAAVKDKIIEDYSLARLLKKAGMRLRFVTAQDVLGVRMYSSLAEIWKGWRKNFYTVSEKHMFARAITRIILMLTFLVLPFTILAYGIILFPTTPINPFLISGAFMSFFLWLGIIILDRSINISPVYALLFPVAIIVYVSIGIDATVRGSLGMGFDWKGRTYGKAIERQLDPTPVQPELVQSP
ncbi:MAG TPA: glycosyltransferase family 2 protein, partial [Candidatus Bathyarchaeia archaeon]|nr:glycosyltransferase family 2 protein [Candidatus Bathyarchaeia archaeon]